MDLVRLADADGKGGLHVPDCTAASKLQCPLCVVVVQRVARRHVKSSPIQTGQACRKGSIMHHMVTNSVPPPRPCRCVLRAP